MKENEDSKEHTDGQVRSRRYLEQETGDDETH